MQAAVRTVYGPPEVVSIQDIPTPIPGKGEFLLKVHAATVNRTDCGFRSAEYFIVRFFAGLIKPRNRVLGCEFAGEVVALGEGVIKVPVGKRLFGFNDARFGVHAEFMVLKEDDAFAAIPEKLSYAEAAPITEGAYYALTDLRAAKVTAGQSILINGGTGAIGSAAIQLAKVMGLEVTAVCGPNHVALVRSLGADTVLDYSTEDFTKLTTRFDVVFDAVGKSSWKKCKPLLKERGVYISTELGPYWQNPFLALFTPLTSKKRVLFPIPAITKETVQYLGDLVARGEFRPLIDRYVPLEDIVDTYRYVEKGFKVGNVVLVISE